MFEKSDNEIAADFWAEHAGQYLGGRSIMSTFPLYKKNGTLADTRLGSMTPAAILIEAGNATLIGRLPPVAELCGMEVPGLRVVPDSEVAGRSYLRTVLEWMVDPERTFPYLAVLPSKRDSSQSLALTWSSRQAILVRPALYQVRERLQFNADKVRTIRDSLRTMPKAEQTWKKAVWLRDQLRDATLYRQQTGHLVEALAKIEATLPAGIILPQSNTGDYDALSILTSSADYVELGKRSEENRG